MRRIAILSTCLFVLGFTSAKAKGEKTNDAKATTEATVTPSETKTAAGTAAFQYISGDVNSAASYGTTQVDGDDLCDEPGSNRCAATFNVDASGHRTGNPTTPVWTKP